jgi:hypothetical protein
VSTLTSIALYSVLVLVGLTVFAAALVALGGWLVQNTHDPDAHH